jgi:hypothetical protein
VQPLKPVMSAAQMLFHISPNWWTVILYCAAWVQCALQYLDLEGYFEIDEIYMDFLMLIDWSSNHAT